MEKILDLFDLNSLLSEEDRMVYESVSRFVENDVLPQINDAFEKAFFPLELIKKLAQLGLFGLTLPSTYGCAGASYTAYGVACQALEYGDSAIRSFVSVQSSLCMYPIYKFGSEKQKKYFLPKMAAGEIIGCFGLTEPNSGSDPVSMATTAKKVAGGYILNGSKSWITNATIADIAIVWAKTEDGICAFIVEKDFKGFQTQEIKHKMSLRASITGELFFDNVFVPQQNLLPGTHIGLKAALSCLNQARYGIAWGAIGAAQACFEIVRKYLIDRKQFKKPLASFQLIQKDLVDMFIEINKANSINFRLAIIKEEERETPEMVSFAKMNACKQALRISRSCRNLLGGNGISLEYNVIRHMLNLEAVFTYEGTDNVHTLILGKYLTGLSAFN